MNHFVPETWVGERRSVPIHPKKRLSDRDLALPEGYRASVLDVSHLDRILELQEIVTERPDRAGLFQPDTADFIREVLEGRGLVAAAMAGEEPAAYLLVYFAGRSERNMGYDVGLGDDELLYAANLETIVAHPRHQAKGLQQVVSVKARRITDEKGYYLHCATVSPRNYPSLKNMLKHHLTVRALKAKYGDQIRYVLLDDRRKPPVTEQEPLEAGGAMIDDFETQAELLKRGLIGYELRRRKGARKPEIVFGRFAEM
jgi:hypothetical protein